MDNEHRSDLMHRRKKYTSIVIVAVLIILVYFFVQREYISKILSVLQPIIIGAVFAYLLNPLVKVLDRFFIKQLSKLIKKPRAIRNISRGISITLSMIVLISVCTAILCLIIPQVIDSVNSLITDFPSQIESARSLYNGFIEKYNVSNNLTKLSAWYSDTFGAEQPKPDIRLIIESITSGLGSYIKTVGTGIISFFGVLLNIIIGLIVTVYLLACKETMLAQVKKLMYAIFDTEKVKGIIDTSRECNKIVSRFIVGKLIDSAIIGILCFIVLVIFKIPYAPLVSVIVAVTDIIPFFGPFIGAIPSAFLIFIANPLKGIYFVVIIIILQQVEGNLISPKIIGDSIGLSPFWVMFAMIVGGGMFGLAGMLMGVPVLASAYFIVKKFAEKKLTAKNLPVSSAAYSGNDIDFESDTQ